MSVHIHQNHDMVKFCSNILLYGFIHYHFKVKKQSWWLWQCQCQCWRCQIFLTLPKGTKMGPLLHFLPLSKASLQAALLLICPEAWNQQGGSMAGLSFAPAGAPPAGAPLGGGPAGACSSGHCLVRLIPVSLSSNHWSWANTDADRQLRAKMAWNPC